MKSNPFTIFPAIDLRLGKVVRLMEGDPNRQTAYSDNPAGTAKRWLDAGASWLHVVNLDGAFGEAGNQNQIALEEILSTAAVYRASIQLGGGLRSLEDVQAVLDLGVQRAILGTLAVRQPDQLQQALARWGAGRISASLDARGSEVLVHGWQEGSQLDLFELAAHFKTLGLEWLVYTDVARDGMQTGYNRPTTLRLARESGLNMIASGGVRDLEDIEAAAADGLPGIILGKALYEGRIDLEKAIKKFSIA
jgi:phosphoribosylformimino-5-aminoimidazole carboxamide ribotide isomerase